MVGQFIVLREDEKGTWETPDTGSVFQTFDDAEYFGINEVIGRWIIVCVLREGV